MERFNLNTWLEDKSRKVIDDDGFPVEIIKWDANEKYPVVLLNHNGIAYNVSVDGMYDNDPNHGLFFADNVWNVEDEHNLKAALGYIEDEYLRRWFKDIVYAKFEKQCENSVCKVKVGETYKCIASPRYTCFRTGDIYHVEDNFVAELINTCSDCFVLLEKQDKPKFNVGDWVVHDMSDGRKAIRQIINMTNKSYVLDGEVFNTFYFNDLENDYHLWTIQDAKDGDVLFTTCDNINEIVFIYQGIELNVVNCYFLYSKTNNECRTFNSICSVKADIRPATKEQRDLLFQKMKEAGSEWDDEKKELKKIEQASTWSEEDNKNLNSVKWIIENSENLNKVFETIDSPEYIKKYFIDWLKSLKDRVQPQPKQEWSEDDSWMLNVCCNAIDSYKEPVDKYLVKNWLKSLKPNNWKPTEGQMEALKKSFTIMDNGFDRENLRSLYCALKYFF